MSDKVNPAPAGEEVKRSEQVEQLHAELRNLWSRATWLERRDQPLMYAIIAAFCECNNSLARHVPAVVKYLRTQEAEPASPPPSAPSDSEICQNCHQAVPVWFAPNSVWNRVIPDRVGVFCPNCFINRAEIMGVICTGWQLAPENYNDGLQQETAHLAAAPSPSESTDAESQRGTQSQSPTSERAEDSRQILVAQVSSGDDYANRRETSLLETKGGVSLTSPSNGVTQKESSDRGNARTVSNQSDPLESNSVAPPSARPAEQCGLCGKVFAADEERHAILRDGKLLRVRCFPNCKSATTLRDAGGGFVRVPAAPKSSSLGEEMKNDISPEEAAGIAQGLADLKAGRVRPLADIERDLGISSGAEDAASVTRTGAILAQNTVCPQDGSATVRQSGSASAPDAGQPTEYPRCTLCGASRIPRGEQGAGTCTFIECIDPLHDKRVEDFWKPAVPIVAAPSAPASAAREQLESTKALAQRMYYAYRSWMGSIQQQPVWIDLTEWQQSAWIAAASVAVAQQEQREAAFELVRAEAAVQTRQLRESLKFLNGYGQRRFDDAKRFHDERDEALRQLAAQKRKGIAELASENFEIAEYCKHWEQRAQAAEAELAKEREHRQALLRKELASASVSNSIEDANEIARLQAALAEAEAERDRCFVEMRNAGFKLNPPETLHGAVCQILQAWMSYKDATEEAEQELDRLRKEAK